MRWRRDVFKRACGGGSAGLFGSALDSYAVETSGWVMDSGRWPLIHGPTGMQVPADFRSMREAKRFAEELCAEVDCRFGSFGRLPMRSAKVKAFLAAGSAKRAAFGFPPVVPVHPAHGRVEFGPDGLPARFYPPTRSAK